MEIKGGGGTLPIAGISVCCPRESELQKSSRPSLSDGGGRGVGGADI